MNDKQGELTEEEEAARKHLVHLIKVDHDVSVGLILLSKRPLELC